MFLFGKPNRNFYAFTLFSTREGGFNLKPNISVHPAKGNRLGTVLLIHGAGEHIGRYSWAIEQWNGAGYEVLGGDLPGYGRSMGKKGHIHRFEEYTEAVDGWYAELMKQVAEPPYIFSHSLGGLIATRFMQTFQRPVKGFISSAPCFGLKVKVPAWKEWIAKTLNVLYPTLTLESGIKPDLVTRNAEIMKQDQKDPYLTRAASVRWYRELVQNIEYGWNQLEQFPDVPLLIHQGGGDLITDKLEAKKWFEALPVQQKEFREWPGFYHELLNEPERDLVMGEIIAWMKKIDRLGSRNSES